MHTKSTDVIVDTGIRCLIEKLGIIDAERFISTIIREKSDYTKWHQMYFADVCSNDFHNAALEYGKANPLLPNLDGVDTVEEQLSIAKQKAGLTIAEKGCKLQRFEVVRHY